MDGEYVEKEVTNLSLRKDIKQRAIKVVDSGQFPGINSLSGLVEKALEELLNKVKNPKGA